MKLVYSVLIILFLIIITSFLSFSSAEKGTTTVLGLYFDWLKEGYPEGVEDAYYDHENEKLIVIIQNGAQAVIKDIEEKVSDAENIGFKTAVQLGQDSTETDSFKRWKGVLALAGAYGLCALGLIFFLVIKNKKRKPPTQNEKNETPEMTEFFNKNIGGQ